MKNLTLITIGILFSLLTEDQGFASEFRTLNYEGAREEGGFNAPTLTNVEELSPSGRCLGEEEISSLVRSSTLTNLRILDLSNQPIVTDATIKQLVCNPTFARIITLRLNGTSVTDEAVSTIVNSPILGSIRDYPLQSEKYDAPSSVIRVYARDTKVTDVEPKATLNFHIEYKPPSPRSTYPWEPINHGVKIVQIEAW